MSFKRGIVEPMIWPSASAKLLDLYTGFAGEFVGAWWYLKGDGTMQVGSAVTLAPQGSPSAAKITYNSKKIQAQQLNGTNQAFVSPDTITPAGDFSVAAIVQMTTSATNPILVARDSHEAASRAVNFGVTSTMATRAEFYKLGGNSVSQSAGSVFVNGTTYLMVMTYQAVGDGTSVCTEYVAGAQVKQDATMVFPLQAAALTGWWVGAREFSGFQSWLQGYIGAAFMTEKVLSPATIAAMAAVTP